MRTMHGGHHGPHLELEGVDPLSIEVFGVFMRTLHLHRQAVTKHLAEQGRSFSQMGCLRALSDNDGISQKDLADMLHLSRPSVTTMLNGLEQDGVIVRREDARDRRLTRVHLTDTGRSLAKEMQSSVAEYINSTVGSLPASDREELGRLLGEFAASIQQVLGPTQVTEEAPAR